MNNRVSLVMFVKKDSKEVNRDFSLLINREKDKVNIGVRVDDHE